MADRGYKTDQPIAFGTGLVVSVKNSVLREVTPKVARNRMNALIERAKKYAHDNVLPGVGPGPHPHRIWGNWPEHVDTGALARSLQARVELRGPIVRAFVITDLDYGMFLEIGWFSPRSGRFIRYPWLRPAFERAKMEIADIGKNTLRDTLRAMGSDRIFRGSDELVNAQTFDDFTREGKAHARALGEAARKAYEEASRAEREAAKDRADVNESLYKRYWGQESSGSDLSGGRSTPEGRRRTEAEFVQAQRHAYKQFGKLMKTARRSEFDRRRAGAGAVNTSAEIAREERNVRKASRAQQRRDADRAKTNIAESQAARDKLYQLDERRRADQERRHTPKNALGDGERTKGTPKTKPKGRKKS